MKLSPFQAATRPEATDLAVHIGTLRPVISVGGICESPRLPRDRNNRSQGAEIHGKKKLRARPRTSDGEAGWNECDKIGSQEVSSRCRSVLSGVLTADVPAILLFSQTEGRGGRKVAHGAGVRSKPLGAGTKKKDAICVQ